MPDYIPRTLSRLGPWFANFSTKLAGHGPNLGVTATEVNQATLDNAAVQHVLNGMQVRQTDAQEFTAFRDEVLHGGEAGRRPIPPAPGAIEPPLPDPVPFAILPRTRDLAQRMKSHPAYTRAIGEDLGIEAPADAEPDPRPGLTAAAETGFVVRLGFAMRGFPMIEIQSERAGEPGFVTIGFDSAAPYLDSRPPAVPGQPEVRRYRARYHDAAGPVGEWSDTVSATAQP
jgi:hypothetical protein